MAHLGNLLMRKYIFLTIVVLLFLIQANMSIGADEMQPLNQAEKEKLLKRLKVVQKKIKTFEADFTEERTMNALPEPLIYKGTLYYSGDNLFFMKYTFPVQYILRVKGSEVIIYVIGSNTADIADMSSDNEMTGQTNIFHWDPSRFKGNIYEDADGFWFKDISQKPGESKLNILLDRETLLVKHFVIIGSNGDTTKIAFTDKKVNHPLPAGVLNFSLPEGIKLNRLGSP
jgi:outer membrane lipoprotein carrier protein